MCGGGTLFQQNRHSSLVNLVSSISRIDVRYAMGDGRFEIFFAFLPHQRLTQDQPFRKCPVDIFRKEPGCRGDRTLRIDPVDQSSEGPACREDIDCVKRSAEFSVNYASTSDYVEILMEKKGFLNRSDKSLYLLFKI